MPVFNKVTLLITHYNRPDSLKRLLEAFDKLNCRFTATVVSDDGSEAEHLAKVKALQQEFGFSLIGSEHNKGLGNNINKGQRAVKTEYTLYVQEDFIPQESFSKDFPRAIDFMESDESLDMVRLYAYTKYPYLKPYKNGYREMDFNLWRPGYKKFWYYSDHPHLRRSNFPEKFGPYAEGIKGDQTEFKMGISFLKKKGKALFYEDYQGMFSHANADEEPSTMNRNMWRESRNRWVSIARDIYRHLKWNLSYLF